MRACQPGCRQMPHFAAGQAPHGCPSLPPTHRGGGGGNIGCGCDLLCTGLGCAGSAFAEPFDSAPEPGARILSWPVLRLCPCAWHSHPIMACMERRVVCLHVLAAESVTGLQWLHAAGAGWDRSARVRSALGWSRLHCHESTIQAAESAIGLRRHKGCVLR